MNYDEKSFGYSLSLTSSYYKLAGMSLIKEYGIVDITPEQYGILFILRCNNGIYQRQISHILMKDRPNVTRMLNILEEKGYLTRKKNPDNKRISKIFITDSGRELIQKIGPYKEHLNEKSTKGISQAELDEFLKTLKKIRLNLEDSFNIQI